MLSVPLTGLVGCAAFATYLIHTNLRLPKRKRTVPASLRTVLDVTDSSEALSLVKRMATPGMTTDALSDRLSACYMRFPPSKETVSALREEMMRLEGTGGEMEFATATVYSSMLVYGHDMLLHEKDQCERRKV